MTATDRSLTITDIPDLGHVRQREHLVMSAQAYGCGVIAAGCAREEDMPSDVAYQHASSFALVLLGYMERGEPIAVDLLVNLLAERFDIALAVGPSPRRRSTDA